MDKAEAAKMLEVPINAPRQVVDEAYHCLTRKYQSRAQNSLDPKERDTAIKAIGLVKAAYKAITGNARPVPAKPTHNTKKGRDNETPRATLGQTMQPTPPVHSPAPAGHFGKSLLEAFQNLKDSVGRIVAGTPLWPPKSPEKMVAVIICVAFFVAAVVIVASVRAQP